MRTGFNGQIAISLTQTEVDGLEAAPLADFLVGAAWSWRGRGVTLAVQEGQGVQQVSSASLLAARAEVTSAGLAIDDCARLEFSNGAQRFVAEVIRVAGEATPMLIFAEGCPAPGQEFWISAAPEMIEPVCVGREDDHKIVAFPSVGREAPEALPGAVAFAAE